MDIRHDVPTRLCCCWACGRGEREPPSNWFRPFAIENAHIIGGATRSRQDCREAIVLLCSRCHRLAHGDTIRDRHGTPYPTLSKPALGWLKQACDPLFFSAAKLAKWSGRKSFEIERPSVWFLVQFERRRGRGF